MYREVEEHPGSVSGKPRKIAEVPDKESGVGSFAVVSETRHPDPEQSAQEVLQDVSETMMSACPRLLRKGWSATSAISRPAKTVSSSTESSGESSGEDVCYEGLGIPRELDKVAPSLELSVDLDVFQNPKTKCSTGSLTCGRQVEGMTLFKQRVYSKYWLCKQCESRRPLRDSAAVINFLDSWGARE